MAVDRRSVDRAPPPAPPARRVYLSIGVDVPTSDAPSDTRFQAAVSETRISRQELAAVAIALLLPIPLLAATGLRFTLPAAIERGVASLQLGGGSDSAVVGVAASPASERPTAAPREAGAPTPDERSPAGGSKEAPTASSSVSARAETPDKTPHQSSPEAHPPTAPTAPGPHADDIAPPGESDSGEPPSNDAPAGPGEKAGVEATVTVESDAPVASVAIAVTEGGVTVDTGGDADLGPPLEVPVAPPDLPLP